MFLDAAIVPEVYDALVMAWMKYFGCRMGFVGGRSTSVTPDGTHIPFLSEIFTGAPHVARTHTLCIDNRPEIKV
jgi:hypothetical protein